MKRPNNDRDPGLTGLLREWQDVPAADEGLAMNVRRQIRANATVPKEPQQASWLGRALTWPRLALACVAVGVALGIGAAEMRDWLWQRDVDMPAQYLRWIQPGGGIAAGGSR